MGYKFIKIGNGTVVLTGFIGAVDMVSKLRDGVLSVGIYDLILLIGPYLDEGLTVIIYDVEYGKFIRLNEYQFEVF